MSSSLFVSEMLSEFQEFALFLIYTKNTVEHRRNQAVFFFSLKKRKNISKHWYAWVHICKKHRFYVMHLNDLNREVKTIFTLTDSLTYTEIDENVTRIAQGFKYSLGISRRMTVIL